MKKTPSITTARSLTVTAAGVLIAAAGASSAATLLDDKFLDGNSTNGTNAGETDAEWFTNKTMVPGTISIVSNSVTGPDEGSADSALRFAAGNGVNFRGILANFTSTTIGLNDRLTLSFDFRYTAAPAGNDTGLRIGLFNSNGTVVTGNASTDDDNDFGYLARFSTNANGTSDLRDVPFGDGQDAGNAIIPTTSNTIGAFGTTSRALRFELTGVAGGIQLDSYFDNSLIATATDTAAAYTTFDNLRIGQGGISDTFEIDNVLVATSVIPEPSVALLGALGMLGLLRRRRN